MINLTPTPALPKGGSAPACGLSESLSQAWAPSLREGRGWVFSPPLGGVGGGLYSSSSHKLLFFFAGATVLSSPKYTLPMSCSPLSS